MRAAARRRCLQTSLIFINKIKGGLGHRPRWAWAIAQLITVITLTACGPTDTTPPPGPIAVPADAVATFCGMGVAEHPGPKGQIWLKSKDQPLWFSQVRDAIAFTLLAEEPKDIRAIWVNDMGKSASWQQPEFWVEARKALFVIGSDQLGGMGLAEPVPFSDRAAAEVFVHRHGGRIVGFAEIPRDVILEH
jgi:copper chaperone NosL